MPFSGHEHRRRGGPRRAWGLIAVLFALAAGCGLVPLPGQRVTHAADGTWSLTNASGTWVTAGNWVGSVIPGSTTTTDNTDTAFFSALLTADSVVSVDANRNIQNIIFGDGNSSTFRYRLAGGSLLLTSGGTISSTGNLGAHTNSIESPLTIVSNDATYRINNDSTLAMRLLSISSAITGQSTAGSTTTLYLGGDNSGTNVFSSALSSGTFGGTLALVKDGSTTWSFYNVGVVNAGAGAGPNRRNFGSLTINGGSLLVRRTDNNQQSRQQFGPATALALANVAGAQLDFGAVIGTTLEAVGFGSLSGGGVNGGNIVNTSHAGNGMYIGYDNTSTTFGGRFITGTGAASSVSGLYKVGTGTLTLTGSGNDPGGTTRLRGGALALDFSQATTGTNILVSTRALSLEGGRLLLTGSNSASNSQSVASTTVASGLSGIALTSNGATGLVASLGAITRTAGGTLDITLPTGEQSTTNGVRTTTTHLANNVLVSAASSGIAYAAVSGTTWAGLSSGNIVGLTSYASGAANYTSANNVDVGDADAPAAGSTVNTLRFNAAGPTVLTLSGTNTVGTGGVLLTPAMTSGTITGGGLRPGGGRELVFINNGGRLTVESVIAPSTTAGLTNLTLSGTGSYLLAGQNTYTGTTTITSGAVLVGSTAPFGTTAVVTITDNPAAVLDLNANDLTLGSLAGGGGAAQNNFQTHATPGGLVAIGANSLSVGGADTSTTYGGRITGSGTFAKVGTGRLTLTGTAPFTGFTGLIVVESGSLASLSRASGDWNAAPWSSGTIQLGKTGGSDNATLALGSHGVISAPIVLAALNTGTLTLSYANRGGGISPARFRAPTIS